MSDKGYSRFFSLQRDATDIQESIFLELLKEDELLVSNPKRCWWGCFKLLFIYISALIIFFFEALAILISVKKESAKKINFATSADRNTTNNHLYRMSQEVDVGLNYLILDSPFRAGYWSKKRFNVLWGRTIKNDFLAITTYIKSLKEIMKAMHYLSLRYILPTKLSTMCLVRLMRGISIGSFLHSMEIEKIVFSLSGNACTGMIEKKLNSVGIDTIHWLHGVGLGFKFDSFSSVTLVNNSYDEYFYKNKICGDSLFIFRDDVKYFYPKYKRDISSIVVYSNLVHNSNLNFQKYGYKVEEELLSLSKNIAAGVKLYWKPHPNCFNVLGQLGDKYRNYVESFGFEFLELENDLEKTKTQYISTISTSFIDLCSQGVSVFLYDKYGDPDSMFKDSIDDRLKFNSAESLTKCLNLFNHPLELKSALTSFRIHSYQGTYLYLLSTKSDIKLL